MAELLDLHLVPLFFNPTPEEVDRNPVEIICLGRLFSGESLPHPS
jgi:hypothetical protein